MAVRCSIFKLLLFHVLVVWCGAKHVALPRVVIPEDLNREVQDSIRNLVHTGIYSHLHLDPAQVQVITPTKVTRDGTLVSHVLDHMHEHGHARARRAAVEQRDQHEVHYNLTLDGKEIRLDLRPSVTFMTPALMVERHTASGRTRSRPQEGATACHYTGTVRGQLHSRVALSACDGLAGLLRTEHGEFWIEPSNQLPQANSAGRPHVVFKRSAVDKVQAYHRAKRDTNTQINQNSNKSAYRNTIKRTQDSNRQLAYQNTRSILNTRTNQDSNRRPRLGQKRLTDVELQRRRNEARRLRENKEAIDKRRRDYLEERRRRLEALRRNPTEYRRQQMKLRMEQRRKQSLSQNDTSSNSKSSDFNKSVDVSRSSSQMDIRGRNRKTNNDPNKRPSRIRPRRKRKRRSKNCATKELHYLWEEKNKNGIGRGPGANSSARNRNNKMNRRNRQRHLMPNQPGFDRSRRSVSKPRHVEVLLVADRSMTEFHDRGNLEKYLLTIMNMVSSLYMDPSIGNYIKVVVVKIILVEEMHAAPELEVSTNADTTLSSFCRWQHQLNPDDDQNPHHHDVAILVTRQDICSQHDTPCRPKNSIVTDDNCCLCHFAGVKYMANLSADDIIFASFNNRVFELPFCVIADHERETIVVAVRGSISLRDIFTDFTAGSEKFEADGLPPGTAAHKGMAMGAAKMLRRLTPVLERTFQQFSHYDLILTGHSLGAGVAVLVALKLRPRYPHLKVFAFSTPAGLISREAARYTESFVLSVGVGDDLVMRLSVHSIENLRTKVIQTIHATKLPKYRIMLNGFGYALFGVPVRDLESTWRRPEDLEANHSDDSTDALLLPSVSTEAALVSRNVFARRFSTARLFTAGRILHIVRRKRMGIEKKVRTQEHTYEMRWACPEDFMELQVMPRMLLDHLPENVHHTIETVLEEKNASYRVTHAV